MFNELKDKITDLTTQVDKEVDSVNELEAKSNNIGKFTFKALEIDNDLKSKKESISRCKIKTNQVEKTISAMKDMQDLITKEQKNELEKKQFYLRNKLEELERSYSETYRNLRDNLWVQALDFINQILGNIQEISNSVLQWQFSAIVQKHLLPSFVRKFLPFSRP